MSTKHSSDNRERRGAQLPGASRARARRLLARPPGASHDALSDATGRSEGAGLEEQQALLLAALERAEGEPVGYQDLRDAGIEYPASVVSELELAGLPLERCYEGPLAERRLLGVRLEPQKDSPDRPLRAGGVPSHEPAPTPVADWIERAMRELDVFSALRALERGTRRAQTWLAAKAPLLARAVSRASGALAAWLRALWERAREAAAHAPPGARSAAGWWRRGTRERARPSPPARDRSGEARRRWLASAALLAASVIVLALLIDALAGAGHGHRVSGHRRAHTSSSAVAAPRITPPAAQPSAPAPATAASPALAAQLEARGHQLLEAGQSERAIPVLQQALLATGENLAGCVEPVRETCLSYAYALYDLGRALLLDHQPAAAALILERRLQIANQRDAVQSALQLARQEAGRLRPS